MRLCLWILAVDVFQKKSFVANIFPVKKLIVLYWIIFIVMIFFLTYPTILPWILELAN